MANLGEILTDEEIHEMITKLDENGDGQIDFEEFVNLMKMRAQERNERDPEEELRDAFNIFDADGSGFIDRNEVRLLMKKLAQDLTDEGMFIDCDVVWIMCVSVVIVVPFLNPTLARTTSHLSHRNRHDYGRS